MKKIPLVLFVSFTFFISSAQEYSVYSSFEFKSKASYKEFEPKILEMAKHLLKVPINDDANRSIALQMIIKWMSGTPDYSFSIDESVSTLMKKDESIIGLYMASMTHYVLENKDKSPGINEIKLNSFKILLEYCQNEFNGVKNTKELRKAIEANNKGELERYLKM